MKRKKTITSVQPPPENNNKTLPIKEQLKQNTLDRFDLQEIFNVHPNTINNWCNKGILSFTKVGRKRFFNANTIDKMMKEREQTLVPGEKKQKRK
jgi:hypothetical protein